MQGADYILPENKSYRYAIFHKNKTWKQIMFKITWQFHVGDKSGVTVEVNIK